MELSEHNGAATINSAEHGDVVIVPHREKVAIIGGHPSYQDAPFNDPTYEVWGCNSIWDKCRDDEGRFRADRWFELHPMSVQTPKELDAIKRCPVPIYTLNDESAWATNSVRFPYWAVNRMDGGRYYTCTFAYQIALAIACGFKEIALYGVGLYEGSARERTVERACVEFWIGCALGRNIIVRLPADTHLCREKYLYGYDYHEEMENVNHLVEDICMVRLAELVQEGRMVKTRPVVA